MYKTDIQLLVLYLNTFPRTLASPMVLRIQAMTSWSMSRARAWSFVSREFIERTKTS